MLLPRLLQVSEYSKRDVPRIGGTEGGFIALVVCLGVVVLGSSIAIIYILLRDHSPSDRDREARREERRYPSESSRLSLKPRFPWSEKLGGMFARGAPSKRSSKSGHGWIQASGDAWEEDELDRSRGREMSGLQPMDLPFRPPIDPYASNDSVPYDPPQPRYTPMPISRSTQSDLRSDESTVPRSASPESTEAHSADSSRPEQNRNRHFSVESANSVRTFEGGTKFIEGL
ncbi:hypothetical protein K438DRAFT_2013776 [Mycena galopus ATCC 62051]|nr:hypothetical protein K438DRAFT_2013776 [Mycena galopus ATCC 62051]